MLDVRSPGSSAVPGWWFADGASPLKGCASLLRDATRARALLVRQLAAAPDPRRLRLVRRTEDVAVIATPSYDEWLATLPKKRRHGVRRLTATVADDPALTAEVVPGREVDPVELAVLLRHNARKHDHAPIVPLPHFTGYLTRLLRQPDVRVLAYRDGTALTAAALLLDHPTHPVVRSWSSLPVEEGGRADLYFHFYAETVRWAAGAGRAAVVLGKGMAEVKKSLGADLVAQYAAVQLGAG
ncbi:MAG: GNAT family N-acetyltransferase [Saccharothrix sp.]|nr:GNAT family N-acetyltransferase [Saccharothrix sp.]